MKVCYRPIRASKISANLFELWNTQSFKDSSDIKIDFAVMVNGESKEVGTISSVIPAQGKKKVQINSKHFDRTDKDVFVNFIYTDKNSGDEIAIEQVVVSQAELKKADNQSKPADVSVKGNLIQVSFDNGSALFDKNKGLVSYAKNGTEYLKANPIDKANGFVPHIYRGRLDNDQYMVIFWKIIGLDCSYAKLVSCEVKSRNSVRYISTVYDFVTRGIFVLARAQVDYCIDMNGKMTISTSLKKVCPLTDQIPRFGVHTELKSEFEKVKYYGRGPSENYSDFKEHAPIGIYETTVSDMAHKYIKPQDSGNRGEVRYSVLTNSNGKGLKFTALERYINFNANHFTLGQLKKAKHIEDLTDADTTFTAIDGFVRGTGSGSCGPIPSKEHMIDFG
ncbi:hypothetical protein, partial [Ruminococcus sp.]|uniref:hypothetical protein n=1 Tax=Ruminococcus sp. TaxID=41978 RepID=UPI003AEF18BC